MGVKVLSSLKHKMVTRNLGLTVTCFFLKTFLSPRFYLLGLSGLSLYLNKKEMTSEIFSDDNPNDTYPVLLAEASGESSYVNLVLGLEMGLEFESLQLSLRLIPEYPIYNIGKEFKVIFSQEIETDSIEATAKDDLETQFFKDPGFGLTYALSLAFFI